MFVLLRKDNFTEKGKVPLAAYMHIYDFAMSQIPNLPESVKFGSYGNLFENYYGKYGFSKLLGMLAQVLNKDMFLYLQAQKNTQKLKDAILYWVLLDDFHFFLMCRLVNVRISWRRSCVNWNSRLFKIVWYWK